MQFLLYIGFHVPSYVSTDVSITCTSADRPTSTVAVGGFYGQGTLAINLSQGAFWDFHGPLFASMAIEVRTVGIIQGGVGKGYAEFLTRGSNYIPAQFFVAGRPCTQVCYVDFEFNEAFPILISASRFITSNFTPENQELGVRLELDYVTDLNNNPIATAYFEADTPEPSTYALMSTGLGALALHFYRKRRRESR